MPEIRKDPFSNRWVVFSPERLRRPLHFEAESEIVFNEEDNPFIEGHESYTPPEVYASRNGSAPNSPGWKVRVVPNRFPALRIEGELKKEAVGFYDMMTGVGAHEVVIETPEPGLELEDLDSEGIAEVLKAYRARFLDLKQDSRFYYLMVFKNVGAFAGASIPHAHSQIVALPFIPIAVKEQLDTARKYYAEKERCLFHDILNAEMKFQKRMVYENQRFGVYCPYASRFAFETCIMPKAQQADFYRLEDHDLLQLADVLKLVLSKYRSALKKPSYNLVLTTAPFRREHSGYWETIDQDFRWHLTIMPRLTGLAGFEMGTGCYINSVYPAHAAETLREAVV
ncbi:MAG: galactose-1-phosphate uridylyltransferase [Verrucomicrobiota bacterium]